VVNRHSFVLIRQMTALVRRALAEVCSVPVLLVYLYLLTVRPVFEELTVRVCSMRTLSAVYVS